MNLRSLLDPWLAATSLATPVPAATYTQAQVEMMVNSKEATEAAKQYDSSRYDTEFEAYHFMDNSGSDIAQFVNEECK